MDTSSPAGRQITEHEAVALDDDAGVDRDGMAKHRSTIGEAVELTALTARVDGRWQIRKQLAVELAAGKRRVELFRVHAREPGAEPRSDHLASQSRRVGTKQREQGRQSRSGQSLLPVAPDVLEKQIAERHVRK